ncbi:MAG: hypothetical protein RR811_16325, partial [Comamonas sp.]
LNITKGKAAFWMNFFITQFILFLDESEYKTERCVKNGLLQSNNKFTQSNLKRVSKHSSYRVIGVF